MKLNKFILPLIIINLTLIAFHFFIRLPLVNKIFSSVYKLVIVPIFISIFIYYLLKPLNDIFVKKSIKKNIAAMLTLIIGTTILFGVVEGLGYYFIEQFNTLVNKLYVIKERPDIVNFLNGNLHKYIDFKWILDKFFIGIKNYLSLAKSAMKTVNHAMGLFSDILLIIIIVFYLLKDQGKFTHNLIKSLPEKYRDKYEDKLEKILIKCDDVLSNYVVGQAKVALSLSTMIFIGYLIIGMPSGLILASITFVLAFIPFVGFFISMIIPYIIAISMGLKMIIKLSILFIVAQTLKGRIVVPLVMSKAMKIHPITDIFLVVCAASIFGPMGAFVIVPIYSVLKVSFNIFRDKPC